MQARAYLRRKIFERYELNVASIEFCVDLPTLYQCLSVFGGNSTNHMRMEYQTNHASFLHIILHDIETKCVTECNIRTFEYEIPTDFNFRGTTLVNRCTIKVRLLAFLLFFCFLFLFSNETNKTRQTKQTQKLKKSAYLRDIFSECDGLAKDEDFVWFQIIKSPEISQNSAAAIANVANNENNGNDNSNSNNINENDELKQQFEEKNNNNDKNNINENQMDLDISLLLNNDSNNNNNDNENNEKIINNPYGISELMIDGNNKNKNETQTQQKQGPSFSLGLECDTHKFESVLPMIHDIFVEFDFKQSSINKYRMSLLRTPIRAVIKADHTRIWMNSEGVLSLQHVYCNKDHHCWIDFVINPIDDY